MPNDEIHMLRALALARSTIGLASPNPQVGCVLSRNDLAIGEGAHLYDRLDHAEIVALKAARAAGHETHGATAYVTLEPCSHQGRTGPCADALIAAGISRCVIATVDPNPQVAGQGIEKLRAAGIEVEVGLLEIQARELNAAFACSITQLRPLVTLKAALAADGRIAPPTSTRTQTAPVFLTGGAARAEVQQLRHASDAILTGVGTVLADDPMLTDRTQLARRRPLLRVILDSQLRTPPTAKLLATAQQDLWIFTSEQAPETNQARLEARGALISRVPSGIGGALDLQAVLHHLHQARILSLLLETGTALNGAWLNAGLVDRVILYYAELELGPSAIPFARSGPTSFALQQQLQSLETRQVGEDVCISGWLHDPWRKESFQHPASNI
jgi:diaminohydroxyphosphoribosylaminopyrimidine deaminase/5-amino-6-(5-phosphoribosylamino)uracil reductase